jgi:hypothetical protein
MAIIGFTDAQASSAIIMSRAPCFGTVPILLNAFKLGSEVSEVHG